MKPVVLIVDDSAFMRLRMKKIFNNIYQIVEAFDGEEALNILFDRKIKFDLVLLDINMPGIDGISVLKELTKHGGFEDLPIVVFSAEEELQLEALSNGAWDFVAKDENPKIIRTRIKNVLERSFTSRIRKENVLINTVMLNIINNSQDLIFELDKKADKLFLIGSLAKQISPVSEIFEFNSFLDKGRFVDLKDVGLFKDTINKISFENKLVKEDFRIVLDSGNPRWCKFTFFGEFDLNKNLEKIVSIAVDVNDFIIAIDNATKKAEHDSLTGLVNRAGFENFFNVAVKKDVNLALLLIDVDNFKKANDTLGHLGGDLILKTISSKLKENFRSRDCVARVGGDEFAVILVNVNNKKNLEEKLNLLFSEIRKPINVYGKMYSQSISIGGFFISEDKDTDFFEAYKIADDCLYKSKAKGKNTYTVIEKE